MPQSLKVTVYSTQTCPYCKMTKTFLKDHRIPFESVDVGVDDKAASEMIRKSGQTGVPVTDVNGKIIVGFDPNALKKALNLK